MDLEQSRREYLAGGLRRKDLEADPIEQFRRWLEQAESAGVNDPTAMVLATASAAGEVSQRIVLLKHFDAQGFVFYTNYESHKARDIAENPLVSLHFPWHALDRQVKIRGRVSGVSREDSDKYFHNRPRESQIAATASDQSRKIENRASLLARYEDIEQRYQGQRVPLPEFWGGYRVEAQRIEFWQGGAKRLHDRFLYRRVASGNSDFWEIDRLAP